MKKKMKKFFDVEVKAADDGSGAYWFTASTSARDRQGDVIVQTGWKTADFMKNPVILWAHNYYETPIGKALELKMSEDLISVKIDFVPEDIDPFAAKVEKLVKGGYLKTVSVGFMVYKSEPLTTEDLTERPEMKYGQRLHGDLLEISIVPVPANPEALNENGFAEVVARGWGLKQDEAKSKFLPYVDEKGAVSARLLKASLAAAMGARGGVKIADAEPTACINHLYRVAKENKIDLPELRAIESGELELKDAFRDVWHDELLNVIQRADEQAEELPVSLIKGERRIAFVAARDALNNILLLTEETQELPGKGVTEDLTEANSTIESIIKGIKETTKNLSGK